MAQRGERASLVMCGIKKDSAPQLQLVGGGHREPIITEVVYERDIRSEPEQR